MDNSYLKNWSPQDILPAGIMSCWQTPSAVTPHGGLRFSECGFLASDREKVYHIGCFDHEIDDHLVMMYMDNK